MPNYIITEKLYEGAHSSVYRGYREIDKKRVMIKLLTENQPSPDEISHFEREYALLQSIQGDGTTAVYSFEKSPKGLAMILEDFGTQSLKQLLSQKKLTPSEFLAIAIQITEALEKIHRHHVIHKDINPSNILVDNETKKIKIINFSIATTSLHESMEIRHSQLMEQSELSYISPEQTGRINRGIDYRSDYYSLGVTFYEMATGMLPFQSEDINTLIHSHIAKLAQPPYQINPDLPLVVSDIIMKLISKTAEERYQSTFGLKADLLNCFVQLEHSGKITPFIIGSKDISTQFKIPEKLYGRNRELNLLLEAFGRIRQGRAELALLSGYSGVGKSSLAQELYKPVLKEGGYFISGKFDQFKRNLPYSSLIQAFQMMIQKILAEDEDKVTIWRDKIQRALGKNGRVVTDLIPMLTNIIGEQNPLQRLEPKEANNRFKHVFQNLIHALAQADHSLVIFLDDCQWADTDSLKFLETILLNPDSRYFLVITAYRSDDKNEINEPEEIHPLLTSLDKLQQSGITLTRIVLQPLDVLDIQKILEDTLHQNAHNVKELARIGFEKTQGNPFFLNQYLQILYNENLIAFQDVEGAWNWDINEIKHKGMTNNVVDLMVGKIKKLSPITQKALQFAACLGNRFDIQTLANTTEKSTQQTIDELEEALQEGLIITIDSSYQFLHDRVQQAAYSLIDPSDLNSVHLKIGWLLYKHTPKKKMTESVLDIVDHLNHALDLITDTDEKIKVSELNMMAGIKVKASIAYHSALRYFKIGIGLLGENCWRDHYDLALSLYTEGAESASLSAEFNDMESYSKIVIKNANNLLDKLRVYENQINYFAGQDNYDESVNIGLSVLSQLGINLPRKPSSLRVMYELLHTKIILRGKSMEDLYNLPEMTDPYYQAVIRILVRSAVAFYVEPKLWILILLKGLNLMAKHGHSKRSSTVYIGYAFILCMVFHQYELGYKFSQLALRLSERYKSFKSMSELWNGCGVIAYWYGNTNESLSLFNNLFQKDYETGDYENEISARCLHSFITLYSGKELNTCVKEIKAHIDIVHEIISDQKIFMGYYQQIIVCLQTVLNLIESEDPTLLVGTACDETVLIPEIIASKSEAHMVVYQQNKLFLHYLFYDYERAYQFAKDAVEAWKKKGGNVLFPEHCLFYSLACLGCYQTATKSKRKELLKYVKANQKVIKRGTLNGNPTYLSKYYVVEAELAHVLGKVNDAMLFYDKAIDYAKECGASHIEGIANERAAIFYLGQGREKVAKVYMNEAYYCYLKWGALTKVNHLKEMYADLLPSKKNDSHTLVNMVEMLDLSTVMKASQTITSEIVLVELLKKMMRIIIENAGAQKGFLMFEKEGKWYIEAEASTEDEQIIVLQSIPIDDVLPVSIIHYVVHTKKPLAVEDAMQAEQFSADSYIQRVKPKSILCMPLLNQGVVSSILYLENNLTTNAFTNDRIELLNLLSGQIINAIDNARLYSRLKDLNQANESFVPIEFLELLEKKNITDLQLGDQVQKEMTVMFCDIRGFTARSDKMTPQETLAFVNRFLSKMTPIITKHHGVIDKYIGDAIMALYPTNADDALRCANEMLTTLDQYNKECLKINKNHIPINVGIGLNTGLLVLGTIGDEHHMEGTVISDAVNTASRVERLTKTYDTNLLITENTYKKLSDPSAYAIRKLDKAHLKGKIKPITIYEVFDTDSEALVSLKMKTLKEFEHGIDLYEKRKFSNALNVFRNVARINHDDQIVSSYIKKCQKKILSKVIENQDDMKFVMHKK